MKIEEPKIAYLEAMKLTERENLRNGEFENESAAGLEIRDCTIDSCVFHNIDFSETQLVCCDIVDTVFEKCDLSNQVFDERYLNRVRFVECRLVGVSFINASLKNVVFESCNARYINLAGAKLNTVRVSNSDFSNMSLLETGLKKTEFSKSELRRSEIYHTPMAGIDVSGCNIEEIAADLDSLKGIVIDTLQMSDVIGLLGIKVK